MTYHSNGLHGKQNGAEEEWHALEVSDGRPFAEEGDVREHVVADDRKADDGNTVGHRAERG